MFINKQAKRNSMHFSARNESPMMRVASTNASKEQAELTIEEQAFDEANGTYQSVSPWLDNPSQLNNGERNVVPGKR